MRRNPGELRTVPIGTMFGRWTVVGLAELARYGKNEEVAFPCRCICGAEKPVMPRHLAAGHTKGCRDGATEARRRARTTPFPIGRRFGKWTVSGSPVWHATSRSTSQWLYPCRCDCGAEGNVVHYILANGHSLQCVHCHRTSALAKAQGVARTHGDTGSPLYDVWRNLPKRVLAGSGWPDYQTFRVWSAAHGYRVGLFLVPIDPARPLTPGNAYWAEYIGSARTRLVAAWGETKSMTAWTRDRRCPGLSRQTLHLRLKKGWDAEEAIITPPTTGAKAD